MTTDVLVRICTGLNCNLEDIMELEKDQEPKVQVAEGNHIAGEE